MAPRWMRTAADEFGFAAYQGHGLTLRPGFYGLLELEGDEQTGFSVWAQQIHFWRGAFSFQASLAFDDLGHRLCSSCALDDFFLPDRSNYSQGPGLDLHLRYAAWRRIHPFFSGYAEYLFATERRDRSYPDASYPDAYLVRGLLRIAVPGTLGDLMVFTTGDVGHRKGLAAYAKEATLGFGVRLAFGSMPGM